MDDLTEGRMPKSKEQASIDSDTHHKRLADQACDHIDHMLERFDGYHAILVDARFGAAHSTHHAGQELIAEIKRIYSAIGWTISDTTENGINFLKFE